MIRFVSRTTPRAAQRRPRAAYLLLSNDPLLLQESQTLFVWRLRRKASVVNHAFTLDPSTDWGALFQFCRAMSLFASRQTLRVTKRKTGLTRQMKFYANSPMDESRCMTTCCLIYAENKSLKRRKTPLRYTALADRSVQVSCRRRSRRSFPLGGRQSKSNNLHR